MNAMVRRVLSWLLRYGAAFAAGFVLAAYLSVGWLTSPPPSQQGATHGRFIGKVSNDWLPERPIVLTADFAYVDPREVIWLAPKGSEVDGASIPRVFWTPVGGPYEGKYRQASVIHDVACEDRERPHQDVHRCFYDACLCEGLEEPKARLLYLAVAMFGPKWTFETFQEQRTVDVQVTKSETRTRTVTLPDGTTEERTYTVQVPVVEQRTKTVSVQRPVDQAVQVPTDEDVARLEKLIQEGVSLDTIQELSAATKSADEPAEPPEAESAPFSPLPESVP